jgi:DNA repair exonuclease SbcCD ATPase subunit
MTETTTAEKPVHYRIVHLQASNIQCLKADGVEIVPNRSTIVLTGRNGMGKSSVINSIAWTLGGTKLIPEQPIRRGASKAETMIDLGDFIASLKITQGSGAKLSLKSKDGLDIRQPATALKSLTNEILIDPVAFLRLGETPEGRRKQGETLRQLVGLDFGALDEKKEQAYDSRWAKNAELDKAKATLSGYTLQAGVPEEEISVKDLMAQIESVEREEIELTDRYNTNMDGAMNLARKLNGEYDRIKELFESTGRQITEALEKLAESDADIKLAEQALADLRRKRNALKDRCDTLSTERDGHKKAVSKLSYEDVEALQTTREQKTAEIRKEYGDKLGPLRKQISEADDTNTKVRSNRRYKELKKEVSSLQQQADAFTAQIEEVEKQKKDQLSAAKFPLEGLSFDETGVLLNGLPLNQGSQAQQLKAVLAIGFALNPKVRVALIRDASILDQASMKEVEAMMDTVDGQAWLEVVESSDPTAIVIEDGAIKE